MTVERSEILPRQSVFRPGLLDGRTVLVTGGGTGIGQGIALLAADLGADLVVCGRRPDPLEETVALVTATGRRCVAIATDIREPADVDALFAGASAELGPIDTVVNNAGGQFAAHAADISDKGWRAVIDTNLNGTWTMMQRAAAHFREHDVPGQIVNITAPSERGMFGVAHTVAARAGVTQLSKNVAVEWAPFGIRVNCVMPGPIASQGLDVYSPAVRAELAAGTPMNLMGEIQDVAEATVYLVAPSGRYVTGEVIAVDGGLHMFGNVWLAGRPEGWEHAAPHVAGNSAGQ